MWANIAKFIWNHFWKMVAAVSWLAFIWFVDSVQQPEKVVARIANLEQYQDYLHNENLTLQIKIGTNDMLFKQVDGKLDRLIESQIILSQRVGQLINKP